ncbi:MAG: metallophosphoesterase [Halobacteriaceae archaeon]
MTELEYGDRWLYLPSAETLIVADLHIGYAASSAVESSLGERDDLAARIGDAVSATDPATVVFAGDLLHAFDGVPTGVPQTLEAVIAATGDADVIVTTGNHDGFLDVVAPELTTVTTHRLTDGTAVCHGHVLPETSADRYVIGHDHPALVVDGDRRPCFLQGTDQYRDASVLMLPAFSRLPRGTPVGRRDAPGLDTPLITDLGTCHPIVVGDSVYEFPALAALRSHL